MKAAVLGWDCWGRDSGVRHANVVQLGGAPEEAMASLLDRAVQKYGSEEWSAWTFRAEPIPKTSGAEAIHFRYEGGALVRRNASE